MSKLDALARAKLFAGLSTGQLEAVSDVAAELTLSKGRYLFHVGDEAESLFVVRQGVVELVLPLDVHSTRQSVVLEEIMAGETIGWSAVVSPQRFTLSARSATEDVQLFAFDRGELESLCRARSALGYRLMVNLLSTVGNRLSVVHAMWVRELQRNLG